MKDLVFHSQFIMLSLFYVDLKKTATTTTTTTTTTATTTASIPHNQPKNLNDTIPEHLRKFVFYVDIDGTDIL